MEQGNIIVDFLNEGETLYSICCYKRRSALCDLRCKLKVIFSILSEYGCMRYLGRQTIWIILGTIAVGKNESALNPNPDRRAVAAEYQD